MMELEIESWKGLIPIQFMLSERSIASPLAPPVIFEHASRFSYLNSAAQTALKVFAEFALDTLTPG